MLRMLLQYLGVHQEVINEDDHRLINHRSTHEVHELHERGRSIGEPIGHHHEIVVAIASPESGLLHILASDPHLMVA